MLMFIYIKSDAMETTIIVRFPTLHESLIAPGRHRSAGSPSATYMTQITVPVAPSK